MRDNSPWTPAFTRFFIAQNLSFLGSSMTPVALSFGVLRATGRIDALGYVLASSTIPMLLCMVAGGVIADRFPRTRVLVLSHGVAALAQIAAAAWFFLGGGPLYVLMACSAVGGIASALTGPALRGVIAELVPTSALESANAARATARNAFRLLGPTMGGVLVAFANAGWALAVDAGCLALAAILLAGLPLGRADSTGTMLRDLRDGWTEFVSRRWVWMVTLAFFGVNVAIGGVWLVLGPVVARDTVGEIGWGVVLGARAAGMIVGGVVAYRWRPTHPLIWMLVLDLPYVAAFAALVRAPEHLTLLVALAAGAGAGSAISGVLWESTLQREIRPGALSRVASFDMLGSFASVPLGQLTAPVVASVIGTGHAILAGTVLFAVSLALPLLSADVRRLRRPR